MTLRWLVAEKPSDTVFGVSAPACAVLLIQSDGTFPCQRGDGLGPTVGPLGLLPSVRGLQLAGDLAERVTEVSADQGERLNGGDRDQRSNQRILRLPSPRR